MCGVCACQEGTALLDTCGLVASVPANVAVWDVAVCNAAMWQRTNVLGMNWHTQILCDYVGDEGHAEENVIGDEWT